MNTPPTESAPKPRVRIRVETPAEQTRPPAPRRKAAKPNAVDQAVTAAMWSSPNLSTPFPAGTSWEVTEAHAWGWFAHRLAGYLQCDSTMARIYILGDELMLLVADLHHYHHWAWRYLNQLPDRAGKIPGPPPPLDEYLKPGRELWGEIAHVIRAAAAIKGLEVPKPGYKTLKRMMWPPDPLPPAERRTATPELDLVAVALEEIPREEQGPPLRLRRTAGPRIEVDVERPL